ncbi:MAG TPA: UPF0182 family protein [Clostridia bacterium]|nr:UPF0182 family protein [Clostridia bacterium]
MKGFGSLKSKGITVLLVVIVLAIAFFSNIAMYLIDYQWFSELGYQEVFFKKLVTQLQFFVPAIIVLFVLFYLYLNSINAHSIKHGGVILSNVEKKVRKRMFVLISLGLSFVLSLIFVLDLWYDFLIFMNKTAFGLTDPIFSKDIGYYIFSLPFLNKLYNFLMVLIFVVAAITVLFNLYNFFSTKTSDEQFDINVRPISNSRNIYRNILGAASKQLMFLGGLFFLLLAGGFYLRSFDLLYSARGIAYGARYTDVRVTLPSYYVYIAICVLTAALLIMSRNKKNLKRAVFGPLLLVVAMVVSGVIAGVVQNVLVAPNEIVKEAQYLQNNINYTNYAYNLDKVQEKEFPVNQALTRTDIEENRVTINNIPINDYRPAKDIYNQIQGLKNYYQFSDMDIDRYRINGIYRHVFISARELQSANIPKQTEAQSASWINRYLKYTHGYGVAMSPVNEVTSSGQPRLFIKDMPVISEIDIKVDVPQIYFGELTKDFAIVNSREKEFDYPATNVNIETEYKGTGGIRLNLLNRILFSVREGKINFLLSQDINSNSKVLINRDIARRVQKIAPFLAYDEDPYIVIDEGRLYWIIDAYTISSRYPYSEKMNNQTSTNYIRNSVKVIIDAYNGTTDFYISDPNDPLINTYSKIFTTLFKPVEEMPEGLRAHLRYPQTLFDIQSDIYKKYHMKNAREFYNKSDVWDVSTQIYGASTTQANAETVESSYLIMRLPDSESEEFLLMVPYTPQGKTNMIAWLAVKNDGGNYGQMVLYSFPSGKIVEGPMQVEGIVSQDTIIGPQLNLLATGGNSQVIRGNMLTIPIEESILYVEPIYMKALNANALPEQKKVIAYFKNQVVMEDTLDKALDRIFPVKEPLQETPAVTPPPAGTAPSVTAEELIRKANDAFNAAQNAQKAGNWAEYGNQLKELEDILKRLNEIAGAGTNVEAPIEQSNQ